MTAPGRVSSNNGVTASHSRDRILPFGSNRIHPSEIHELRIRTPLVRATTTLQQMKLNARLLLKREAINRTIEHITSEQTITEVSWDLRIGIKAVIYDDTTAVSQEIDEEPWPTFLDSKQQQDAREGGE
jgi:hypothetical protein